MTRINIIDTEELTDQHLMAEWREITMIPAALKTVINSKNGLDLKRIPKKYTLGTGHIYFFFDKGKYLMNRYTEIRNEMNVRGFKPDPDRIFNSDIFIDNNLYNDWTPTITDYKIIRKRIEERITKKPEWYRKTERTING